METTRVNWITTLTDFLNAPPSHLQDLLMLMLGPPVLAKILGLCMGDDEVFFECYPPVTTPYAVFAVPDHGTEADSRNTSFFLDLAKCGFRNGLACLHSAASGSPARAIHTGRVRVAIPDQKKSSPRRKKDYSHAARSRRGHQGLPIKPVAEWLRTASVTVIADGPLHGWTYQSWALHFTRFGIDP